MGAELFAAVDGAGLSATCDDQGCAGAAVWRRRASEWELAGEAAATVNPRAGPVGAKAEALALALA
eukprot:13300973-Alexandrium_andersonii.AAC.1